jgi:hypothetical protein
MIYKGFNKVELDKISEILERSGVTFHISVPEESLEFINDTTKRVNHRFMDNLMQIEIEKEEFSKISSPKDLSKLFDLRIYPEEESPFTEEELAGVLPEGVKVEKKPDPNAKINQMATLLAVTLVFLFFAWKNGYFK